MLSDSEVEMCICIIFIYMIICVYFLLVDVISLRKCYLFASCCLFGLLLLVSVLKDFFNCELGGDCIDMPAFVEDVELGGEALEAAYELLLVVVVGGTYGTEHVCGMLLCDMCTHVRLIH